MLREITLEMLHEWRACWSDERILGVTGGRRSLTPLEACDLVAPVEALLWLLLREEVIPAPNLHELACVFAEHRLLCEREAGREPDPHSWEALAVKRRWLQGEATSEELATAALAAASAAWATAWAAVAAEWKWQLEQVRACLQQLREAEGPGR